MVQIGSYNSLKIIRDTPQGYYLDDGKNGILLPRRFIPPYAQVGDMIDVFVYNEKADKLIATTQKPYGVVGDIVKLKAITVTPQGAFLDNGLMKDLFVPTSKQLRGMREGYYYLVKIYLDEITNRVCATERLEPFFSNENLTIKEKEEVDLIVYRSTPLGLVMVINAQHTGILHQNEIYSNYKIGDRLKGYIKKIYPNNKVDVVAGKEGYTKVEDESSKIMSLLEQYDGFLPYHDKSDPKSIYDFFGMSKKVFKMTVGKLYKERKIILEDTGIKKI